MIFKQHFEEKIMIKKISLLFLAIFLLGCKGNQQKNSPSQEEKTNTNYPFCQIDGVKEDDSLYTRSNSFSLPSDIKTDQDKAYSKDELANLDYDKEILFSNIYIRLPKRSKIFTDGNKYYIDFPYSESYNIFISFDKIKNDEILKSKDILRAAEIFSKTINYEETRLCKPIRNKMTNIDSAYFVTDKKDRRITHLLVDSPNGIIHFAINENKKLSDKSKDIMSDLLIAMYKEADDPLEIGKDFTDYTKDINVFASKKIDLDDLKIRIPEDFKLSQDKNGIKAFISKKNGNVISEIIMKYDNKDEIKLEDAYDINSGSIIYPANIVTSDLASFGRINKVSFMKGKARLYMPSYSLKGDKIVIDTDKGYLSLFVLGPINDNNQTNIMSTSIINSIEK
ncbi:hypothetical protein HMPREF0077_1714 [Anaerococcus tetradius ATCC 35098]|jgi:hypothetical protein|uniref:Lipoprotein n=2 Tax=Anaerococcus tetradius TaxID=33036 RepID=C2CJQ4_9FIRM|nr:hypothetical protein HMPREF0077_1714 [Anaerococcus tetradius ATCC 35098]